jgi:hypothetical protein
MTSTTATYPVAPEITPLWGTLLDAAKVQDGIAWLDGRDLWVSGGDLKFGYAPVFCGVNSKNLDSNSVDWVSGFQVGAYGALTCRLIGTTFEEMEEQVREGFASGESTAIERALMDIRFRAAAGDNVGRWATPTDITPAGGAVHPRVGLALLEGRFSALYSGSPTIHMPRNIASLLAATEAIQRNGDVLYTKLGSLIAAGAGYDYTNYSPAGVASAEMERWVYASGPVYVGRGDMITQRALDQSDNDATVLAERPYIVAVDGPVLALRVTVAA